jgi:hypothetical protein
VSGKQAWELVAAPNSVACEGFTAAALLCEVFRMGGQIRRRHDQLVAATKAHGRIATDRNAKTPGIRWRDPSRRFVRAGADAWPSKMTVGRSAGVPVVASSGIWADVDCDAIDRRWEKRSDQRSRHAPE